MAKSKKLKNDINNNFEFDSALDFDDLDFNADPFKDDRKPAMKVKDGLVSGFKSKVTESQFIRDVLRNVLPKGFGDTIDSGDKVAGKLGDIYREGAGEVGPAIRDFKRVSSKLIPKDSKYVPDRIKAILKKWEDESKRSGAGSSDLSVASQRDTMIAQQLGQIFKEQVIQDEKSKTESDVKSRIQEAVELNRHKDIFGLLNQSNISLSRISQYQTTINLQYQKKSLELQHRQLFALHDIVNISQKTHTLHADSYQKLVKNTGLPDWQKINLDELTSQKLFNKFSDVVGTVARGMMPSLDDYLQMTARKVKDKTIGRFKENIQSFRSGLTDAESARESMSGMQGIDPYEMGGSLVAGEATGAFGEWAASKLKKPLGDRFPKLVKAGGYLENFNENIVTSAEKFRKDSKYRSGEGPLNWLISNIQNFLPSLNPDTSFSKVNVKDLNSVQPFTLKTDRSINEIIPGYLSRILRELQVTRTGDSGIEPVVYDHQRGRFTSESKLLRSISSSIFSKKESGRTKGIMDSIIQDIDPEGKLNEGERKKLAKAILKNKTEYKDLSTGLKGRAKSLTEDFIKGKEADPEELIVWNRRVSSLIKGASDPRTLIEEYISQGRQKELINLGLIKDTGTSYELNTDAIYDIKLGEDPYETMMSRSPGKKRSASKHKDLTVKGEEAPQKTANFLTEKMKERINKTKTAIDNSAPVKIIKGLKSSLSSMNTSWSELYINGESEPRMTADKLNNGHYADIESGEVLTSMDDVTGGVRDVVDGKTVLGSDEINRVVIKDNEGNSKPINKNRATRLFSKIIDKINKFDLKSKYDSAIESIRGAWNEAYIPGEIEPRLQESKLIAGHYVDLVTGKVIKTLKDIHGGVKDITKDKVVLKAEEVNELYIKDLKGKMHSYFEFTRQKTEPYISKAGASKALTTLGGLWDDAKTTFSMLKSTVFGAAKDVWVQGEKSPRLTAIKMQQGKYFDSITKTPIFTPDDIKGEVMDDTGQVKITVEDLPNLVIWSTDQKRFGPIRKLLRGLDKIYGAIGWYYRKIGIPLTKFNLKMLAKATGLGVNIARAAVGTGPLSVKDVYVGDEKQPRLYAVKIRNGEYFNKVNDKPIYHQSDIKGEVVDSAGNTVLFEEDLPNLRVYDSILKMFNPLKLVGLIVKGAGRAASWMLKKGLSATGAITKFMAKAAGATIGKVARYLSKPEDVYVKGEVIPRLKATLMKLGRYVSEKTGKTIELVTDIDGPVWDAQEQTKVIDNDDIANGLVLQNGEPIKTGVLSKALSAFKKINKFFSRRVALSVNTSLGTSRKLGGEDTPATKTVSLLQDIKDIFTNKFSDKPLSGDTDGDGIREGSWQDILAKRKSEKDAKKPVGADGKPVKEKKDGILGMIAGALQAITGFIGGFGKLLKGGAVLKGLGAMLGLGKAGAALAGAASVAGTVATGIGAGVAAVVGSPVALGVLGAAVAGYGAYRGYKAVRKWMSKPTAIETIRYVQYGFKKEETAHFSKVLELEEYLRKITKVGTDQAQVDDNKLDLKEVMSIFGFSPDEKSHKTQFGIWYIKRFKPVYLTHVSALNIINGSMDLSKINDLKKEDKLKYIEAVRFPSGPYGVNRLPILDTKETASNSTDVAAAVEFALREVSTKPAGDKGSSSVPADGKRPDQLGEKSGKVDYGKPSGAGAKLPGSGVAGSAGIAPSKMGNNVSAFDIVRFKTYGLKELDTNKVISLTMLEIQMAKKVTFQGTKAVFEGNPNELLENVTTYFGIPDLFSPQAVQWNRWFIDRFLPVYLNYATLHMIATNKAPKADGMSILTPNQQYDTALALSSTSRVWRVSKGPWADYELNTNPETIKGNLDYLKGLVRDEKIPDKESKTAENAKTKEMIDAYKTKERENGSGLSAPQPGARAYSPSQNYGGTASVPASRDSGASLGSDMGTGPVKDGLAGYTPDPTAKIPNPTGAGINGLKDTIIGAAKTVGIDPNIMLTTAALESDFNPNAKAKTSSASGLMQFIKATWQEIINRHGSKYGYDRNTSPFDAKASAIMGSHYIKDSLSTLSKSYKGPLGAVEAYLVHFMGPGGASKFLKTMQSNPGMSAAQLMPEAARANQNIYFGSNGPRSLQEVYQLFYNKVKNKAAKYGVNIGNSNATVMPAPASTPGTATPGSDKYVMPAPANSGATSVIDTPPKSPYNPVARPAIKQKEAVDASRQASAPPMGDVNGFNPATLNMQTQTGNATKNTLTGNVMVNTENLLGQSLDVQKQTLDVMKMIYDKIDAKSKSEEPGSGSVKNNVTKQANGYSYDSPKAPVPMRKT